MYIMLLFMILLVDHICVFIYKFFVEACMCICVCVCFYYHGKFLEGYIRNY